MAVTSVTTWHQTWSYIYKLARYLLQDFLPNSTRHPTGCFKGTSNSSRQDTKSWSHFHVRLSECLTSSVGVHCHSYSVSHKVLKTVPLTVDTYLLKESLGPKKENNSLKGPLLNHPTSEKTKHNFSSILMLQASCIYLGLISPCLETYHPLHPPRRLITPCPTTSVISTKEYSKYPSWLMFPLSLPQISL